MNNIKNFEEFNEAIGFKVKGDNRDADHSGYSKLGFNSSQSEITDRLYSVIDKLHALAERGVGGEKETAKRKLQEIGKKYGINTSTKVRGSTKLGFKFSWEDEEFIDDIDNETERKLLNENYILKDPKDLIIGQRYHITEPVYDDFDEGLESEMNEVEVTHKTSRGVILKNIEHDWSYERSYDHLLDCELEKIE